MYQWPDDCTIDDLQWAGAHEVTERLAELGRASPATRQSRDVVLAFQALIERLTSCSPDFAGEMCRSLLFRQEPWLRKYILALLPSVLKTDTEVGRRILQSLLTSRQEEVREEAFKWLKRLVVISQFPNFQELHDQERQRRNLR